MAPGRRRHSAAAALLLPLPLLHRCWLNSHDPGCIPGELTCPKRCWDLKPPEAPSRILQSFGVRSAGAFLVLRYLMVSVSHAVPGQHFKRLAISCHPFPGSCEKCCCYGANIPCLDVCLRLCWPRRQLVKLNIDFMGSRLLLAPKTAARLSGLLGDPAYDCRPV